MTTTGNDPGTKKSGDRTRREVLEVLGASLDPNRTWMSLKQRPKFFDGW